MGGELRMNVYMMDLHTRTVLYTRNESVTQILGTDEKRTI